jgi:sialate O-acetylesterase
MLLTALILASAVQEATLRYPFLSPIFSDHMVLQRDQPNTFWGWTEPGKKVRVSIAGESGAGIAGTDGKWVVKVKPPKVGGPYQIDVSGPSHMTLSDVLVGDVWLCGGQSNMQFGVMGSDNGKAEVAAASHPQIRFTIVPTTVSFYPRAFEPSPWQVCSPDTIGKDAWNGLSAVGYFFGRELQSKLNIPIGLVHDCRGASSAESWISRASLEKQGGFEADLAKIDQAIATGHEAYRKRVEPWVFKSDPGSINDAWAKPELDDSAWQVVSLPASYAELGFGWHVGVTWFRTDVEIPGPVPPGEVTLSLGGISELDWTWVNGTPVGSSYGYRTARNYKVPASLLKAGKNVIAIRVLSGGASDGFVSPADQLSLRLGDGSKISLAGAKWRVSRGPNLWSGQGEFPAGFEDDPHTPIIHFNSMICPVAPLAIRGAIWYQGESNVGRSRQYIDLMQRVAGDWRDAFKTELLPFFQVQLANFQKRASEPTESSWAALREAQTISSTKIPQGGIVTAVDIGNPDDIHPHNKQEVGLRLGQLVLNRVYGQKNPLPTGPTYRSYKIDGSSIRIQFDYAKGLRAKADGLRGFALAGADHHFYWATAVIVGDEVVLTSPDVPNPVAARYGWADNPEMTLYNQNGLPAFPFRTDSWTVY